MKVVILHDWLTCYRGGEKVLEAICELFPEAPIYTLIHQKGSTSDYLESKEIHTSFLQKIPQIHKYYRYFLPIMPLAASCLKLPKDTDLILSTSHCVIKGVPRPKSAKHVCYIHTPMRYIYDQFDNYFGNSSLPVKILANIARPFLTWWDKKSNKNVDFFLPNSKFVKERILKFYGENPPSKVVYPFVDLKDFKDITGSEEKGNYYLMVSAFAPNKRLDLAIQSFNELGLNLKIIGGGSSKEEALLRNLAKDNIEFLGFVDRKEVTEKFKKAKALIFPGVEDFGITPLESLASGTPVIAYKFGGVLETLTDETAYFFNEPTSASLTAVVKNFEKGGDQLSSEKMIKRANEFGKKEFVSNYLNFLQSKGINSENIARS